MKTLAINYYQRGYGCSGCILKAAETKFNLHIDEKTYSMLAVTNSGFGIGGLCSVVIASVMILGLLFDEDAAKRRRIMFLNEFQQKHGRMNCQNLISKRRSGKMCEGVIYSAMEILESVIYGQ